MANKGDRMDRRNSKRDNETARDAILLALCIGAILFVFIILPTLHGY